MNASSVRCSTSVGTLIAGSSGRGSNSAKAADEAAHAPRAGGEALEAREPRAQPLVAGRARREHVDVRALAPAREHVVEARVALVGVRQPRQVVVAHGAQHAGVQDERGDALGMARREDRRQRAAGRVGEQRGALAAGRVEHGVDVAELGLDGQLAVVGQPRAAAVHDDQPRETGQAVEEARQARVLPDVLDVVDVRADEQQVERPVAVDLEGEVDVAVAGVAREAAIAAHYPRASGALAARSARCSA